MLGEQDGFGGLGEFVLFVDLAPGLQTLALGGFAFVAAREPAFLKLSLLIGCIVSICQSAKRSADRQ
jgi:hypothetical protein